MHQLGFRHTDFEDYYNVLIDGRPAAELLGEQLPGAAKLLAGDTGIGARYVTDDRRMRLVSAFSNDGLAADFDGVVLLLTCGGCNIWGCSDHYIHLRHDQDQGQIVWSRYEKKSRATPISAPIGPFCFDAMQYRTAVNAMLSDYAERFPGRTR